MTVTHSDSVVACPRCQPWLASCNVCAAHHDTYVLRWKPGGFTFADFLAWQPSIRDAGNAAIYKAAGLNPDEALAWANTQLPATTAVAWRTTGLSPADVVAWLTVRTITTIDDYRSLVEVGHTADSAQTRWGRKQPFRWSACLRSAGPGHVLA